MKYFVSYSRQDSEFVKKLTLDLKIKYMDVWLDQIDIPVGTKWDTSIEHALNESQGFILMLSKASVQSDNVMDEVNYAITKGKHIIPVLLDDCEIPFRIARIQMIDSRGDYNKCLEAILATTYDRSHEPHATIEAPAPVKHSFVAKKVQKIEGSFGIKDKVADTHFVSVRKEKRKKKVGYALFGMAVLLAIGIWLFATSSGNNIYASVIASITDFTDSSFLDKEKFGPGLLVMIIVGAIAGWIAVKIVDSDSQSFLLDILVGIAGGFIATKWIFHGIWHLTDYYYINLTITTTIGAAILAIAIKLIRSML